MASLFCGRPSSRTNDGGFMPGEDNFSNAISGESKHLIVIPARRRLRRSKGLTAKAWRRAFDNQGRATNVANLLGKVQRGGVHSSVRPEVWELLLGVWPVDSTAEERRALSSKRRLLYAEVLDQCRQIHPGIGSGKLAYAVNDSRILDARTAPSTGTVSSTVPSPPRESEAEGKSDAGSKELPKPPRRSLERVRIGSRAANELGWGAKFLFAIAERNAKDGLSEARPALDVWLEWYADDTVVEAGVRTGGDEISRRSVADGVAEEGSSVGEVPNRNLEITPEITPEINAERTPGQNVVIVRELIPETGREVTSDLAPEITPEAVPEIIPELIPEITPAQASEITPATTSGSTQELMKDDIGGRALERPSEAGAVPSSAVPGDPGNESLVGNGERQENQGPSSLPPLKPGGLGRVKTMVAELERRAREEALEVQASFSRRPKGVKLGKATAAETVRSGALLRGGSQGQSLSGPSEKVDKNVLTSAAGPKVSDGPVPSSPDVRFKNGGAASTSAAGAAGEGRPVLTSAGEAVAAAEDGAAVVMSAAGSFGEGGAALTSATAPAEGEPPVLTSVPEKTAGNPLYRGASLGGLAPEPGPLSRSRSAAVILTSAVSANSETNPGDDDSVAGYGTPGSRFTTFSTEEGFFTPDRSLSAFSTPKSAAYATPDEGFFTPERRARSASASPALSRGSARSVNRPIPKPSDWNARKEGVRVSEGAGPKSSEGQSESVLINETSVGESVNTVDPKVGPLESGGDNVGDSQVGGESTAGGSVSHGLVEGVNKGPLEPVVVRESRLLRSENPKAGSMSNPPDPEASQALDEPITSGADAPKSFLGNSEHGGNGPKKRGVNGPSEMLLVVEDGSMLTALGQGPVHTLAAQPCSLGRASVTPDGLTIRKTAQGGEYRGQKAPRVVTRNKRRLYSGASGEGPEQPEGPVNATPAGFPAGETAEERLTGPEAEKAAEWLWTLHRIVVDVVRTDRNLEFYDVTSNLARMADILAVYAWLDPEVGYCQGMSDLLSPFVVLFEDDADAFWCFARLMRRVRHNFGMRGPVGVLRQLDRLREIVAATDPTVGEHLRAADADNFLFAFRILLVMFRRELSFSQVLTLWEMLWAADFDFKKGGEEKALLEGESACELAQGGKVEGGDGGGCEDELCVFCVAAILHHNRARLRKEVREMDDAVKLFNAMELRVDVRSCVESAIKQRKAFFRKMQGKAKA